MTDWGKGWECVYVGLGHRWPCLWCFIIKMTLEAVDILETMGVKLREEE